MAYSSLSEYLSLDDRLGLSIIILLITLYVQQMVKYGAVDFRPNFLRRIIYLPQYIYYNIKLHILTSSTTVTTNNRKVVSLHTYPVKSCRALKPQQNELELTPYGFKNDRVFMLAREGSGGELR
jgi:hypothetical protein